MKPIVMALCAGWLAIGLGGCETATSLFGSSSDTPTASVASPPPMAAPTQPAQLAIAPVIGPPETVSQQLQAKLIADIESHNIRVAKSPNEQAEYTLRGYVVSSLEKKGHKAKISYIWDVTDGSGKGVHRVSGEESTKAGAGTDPWAAVSPPIIDAIAKKTVTSIAGWLPAHSGTAVAKTGSGLVQTAAATQPPPPARPAAISTPAPSAKPAAAKPAPVTGSLGRIGALKARVPGVTGAPGDGSSSLRAALQRELARNGVALADAPSAQTYTVEGKVALGPGKDGKQPITIDWKVTDPSGKKLGTVSQKNEVPQGSLDGAWGKTADAAAAAAAQGILKLLPRPTKTSAN
jgi:uncharacterized lipoprotein YmbA